MGLMSICVHPPGWCFPDEALLVEVQEDLPEPLIVAFEMFSYGGSCHGRIGMEQKVNDTLVRRHLGAGLGRGGDTKVSSRTVGPRYQFEGDGIWRFGSPVFKGEDNSILIGCQIGIGIAKGMQI
jgi:hypothetical protein